MARISSCDERSSGSNAARPAGVRGRRARRPPCRWMSGAWAWWSSFRAFGSKLPGGMCLMVIGTEEIAAQSGTAARPRCQLLTCRMVNPVRRANAAWLRSVRLGSWYRTECYSGSPVGAWKGDLHAINPVIMPNPISSIAIPSEQGESPGHGRIVGESGDHCAGRDAAAKHPPNRGQGRCPGADAGRPSRARRSPGPGEKSRRRQHLACLQGDCLKIGGQAASAIGGDETLAGWNFCPKPEPNVPL